MQNKFMNLILVVILFLLAPLYGGCNSQNHEGADPAVGTHVAMSVNDAVRNLKPDTAAWTVTGVVKTVTPDDKLLTLIDVEEYKTCGLSDCCLCMPVIWKWEMPKIEDKVTIQGTIESTESGMVFLAGKLHIERNAASQ